MDGGGSRKASWPACQKELGEETKWSEETPPKRCRLFRFEYGLDHRLNDLPQKVICKGSKEWLHRDPVHPMPRLSP